MGDENNSSLAGQWLGKSNGDPSAEVLLDVDAEDGAASGIAYLFPDGDLIPSSLARIRTEDGISSFDLDTIVTHFYSNDGRVPTWDELGNRFPDVTFPENVNLSFNKYDSHEMEVTWKTPAGTYGKAKLSRTTARKDSEIDPILEVKDWDSFQRFVTSDPKKRLIFRGQARPWPLTTSFHRSKRRDLKRYLDQDIPRLHQALSARTKHLFDRKNPLENGAFLNLAQHHGYPTPLLDWTYSPFVAAYFAFSGVVFGSSERVVRVFVFDQAAYRASLFQHENLTFVKPHFSIIDTLAIENERAIPQQGLLALTNVEDIERFVRAKESFSGQYLRAIDLPVSEAEKALNDLRLMGITKATLFPGIESICEELRNLYFS
ncbi:hypothetical protein SuNHUV7_01240 (plasmid) [Pseudoseohaeicola sp. NH-UV-7]|uniref:FRG domain-containing protein n=1 Tax=Sulfitobacter sp. TBRI5 TaxID=2989732 RepID=UPI003A653D64